MGISFEQFADLIREQFAIMCKTGKLFVSSFKGIDLWDLYLNSFAPEDNYVFRDPNSSVNNCNRDRHFIQTYGNIVAIDDDNNISTMFDIYEDVLEDSGYYNSVVEMRKALKAAPIRSVFAIHYDDLIKQPYEKCKKTQKEFQLGYVYTTKQYTKEEVAKFGVVTLGKVYTFHHFWLSLPRQYVLFNYSSKEIENDSTLKANNSVSIGTYLSEKNSAHDLFVKGLSIPLETLQVVSELMAQGSLLRADLYKYKVDEFINIKQEYDELTTNKLNWTWKKFADVPFARFANELIGKTCIDLAEGKDINVVCESFNKFVDSANYMKAKAPITERQRQQAADWIVENGYGESFNRRFAVLADIDINERIHTNSNTKTKTNADVLFSKVKTVDTGALSRHKKNEFDKIEEVSIETFLTKLLPSCTSIQVFLENGFNSNLVTMTTSADPEAKNPFKWDKPVNGKQNMFSWSYNGNLAAKSNLREMVVAKGGRVDGVFRFTHSWNEIEPNNSLMDLHVFLPSNKGPEKKICNSYGNNQERVGWGSARRHGKTGGSQDVDYVNPAPAGYVPVENITFPSLDRLPDGDYKCKIHNWQKRDTAGRGKAEIAFGDETYEYIYPATQHHEWVDVATVTLRNGCWSIVHHLEPVASSSSNLWGLDTNQFHTVNLISLSPNYWGDNAVGVKHYFFFLDGCHSDKPMRSFHIENLNSDLLKERKVLEVFGISDNLEPTEKQLAGLGFTDDSKETLIVKLTGRFKRAVRIRF